MDINTHNVEDKPVWARPKAFGESPQGHGWLDPKGRRHDVDSYDHLLTAIAEDERGQVILVWTPDQQHLVLPEELSGQAAAKAVHAGRSHRIENDVRRSSKWFGVASAIAAAWLVQQAFQFWQKLPEVTLTDRALATLKALSASMPVGLVLLLWLALVFIPWYQSRSTKRRWIGEEGGDSKSLIPTIRFETWMLMQHSPVTRVLAVLLVGVFLFQWWLPSNAVLVSGLVKPAYHAGEFWRLLTAPWVHGNLVHLIFNGLALLYLGKRVELFARWPHLLLVLLIGCLGGGMLSVQAHAHASVGISGGLMAWLGFLLVFETLHGRLVTRSARRRLLAGLVLTMVMGLIGYRFIDNAAHLGGLLAGLAYALIVFPASSSIHRPRILKVDRVVGMAAGLVLLVGIGLAILRLWQG